MAQNQANPPFKTPNPDELQSQETKSTTINRLEQQRAVRTTDSSSDSGEIDNTNHLDDVSDHTSTNNDAVTLDSADPDSFVSGTDDFAMRQAYHASQSSQ
jgi:hypothetical protein